MRRTRSTRRTLRSAPATVVALLHFAWATGLPLPVYSGSGGPAARPAPGCCSGKSCGCAANVRGRSCCCVAAREVAVVVKPAPKPKTCCEPKSKPAPAPPAPAVSSWATVSLRAAQGCGHGELPTLTPSERPAMLGDGAVTLPERAPAVVARGGDEEAEGTTTAPPVRPPRTSL